MTGRTNTSSWRRVTLGLAMMATVAAACSDGSPAAAPADPTVATTAATATTTPTTTTTEEEAAAQESAAAPNETGGPVVEVVAADFAFEGLPERIEAGTTIVLTNVSDVELHEFVAIPLADDDTRSMLDIITDPDALPALFPVAETVIIAPPGAEGFPVVGSAVLTEPGRYAIVCAIPIGANPDEYLTAAAAAEGGPPEVDGGPPHFTAGMYAEVLVEG